MERISELLPERALKRRNLVLTEMFAHGDITKKQLQLAKQKALKVEPFAHRPANRYPAFIDLVRRQLTQEYNETDLTSEGLKRTILA
jgi:penicillin-binding protein 1B